MYETDKYLVYEHNDFLEDIETLVGKLKEFADKKQLPLFSSGGLDGVYGIPAGGLVLAVYLHYRLKLPLMLAPTEKTLVVDDIVDTGSSMSHYISKGNVTASLFFKVGGRIKPHIWLREKNKKWVCFPWEGNEEYERMLPKGRRGTVCPTGATNL